MNESRCFTVPILSKDRRPRKKNDRSYTGKNLLDFRPKAGKRGRGTFVNSSQIVMSWAFRLGMPRESAT